MTTKAAKSTLAPEPVSGCTLLDRVRNAGLSDELLGEVNSRLRKIRRRRQTAACVVTASVCLAAVLLWAVPYIASTNSVVVPAAHRQVLTLADGSTVELNARTELRSDFRYGGRVTRLLKGEAFFSVFKDPSHPFLVITPGGTIRVTGTHFNVLLTADERVQVTLLEGKVDVAAKDAPWIHIVSGQQLELAKGASVLRTLPESEMENVTAWRRGQIVLDGVTLAEASARLSAFHGCRIDVSPEVAAIRLGGSYPLDDLSRFLDALTATQVVRVVILADGSYRIFQR